MAIKQPIFKRIGQDMYLQTGLPTIISWDNKTRPKKARVGTLGFNVQTNSIEYYDGTYWVAAELS